MYTLTNDFEAVPRKAWSRIDKSNVIVCDQNEYYIHLAVLIETIDVSVIS